MNITSFNPLILTSNYDEIIKVFEALGFEQRHTPTGVSAEGRNYQGCRLTDANGFHVDVAATSKVRPHDDTCIRMNVDNFEEGVEFLKNLGFTNVSGKVVEAPTSKSCLMVSPSGFGIDVCEHLK